MIPGEELVVDEGSDFFPFEHFLQVAIYIHVEDVDRQVVLFAHGSSREVHDF